MTSKKTRTNPPVNGFGESQFRALMETALDVVAVLNYDGTFRYLSPSIERVTGYPPEELIGENAFAKMHEDDALEQFEVFSIVVSDPDLVTAGEPRTFRFRHKDGHWIVLEAVSTKLPEGPEPPGILVNARDVTDRMQAHESMREMAALERRLAQENEVIAEVGRIISSTLKIEEVFELFAAQVRRLIKFDMIAATVVDRPQQTTTIRYWSGPAEYRENFRTTVPLRGSVTGEVVASGKPVLVSGTSHKEIRKRFIHLFESHQGGALSWLGIPMVHRGQTIGALLLFSSEPQVFSDEDVALAGRVGSQIAGAIDNAELFVGLKKAESELAGSVIERSQSASQNEVIAEIGRVISSTLEIDEVYEPFAVQVRNLINFDVLSIGVVEEDGQSLRIAHRVGDDGLGRPVGALIPFEGSLVGQVAKSKRATTVQGFSEREIKENYPGILTTFGRGVRSWLFIPLVNRGEFVGTLLVFSKKENAFDARDANLAQRVGDQIAGAIGAAGLFRI